MINYFFKLNGDLEHYEEYIGESVANYKTLSLPFDKVKAEYSKIKAQMDEVRAVAEQSVSENIEEEPPSEIEYEQEPSEILEGEEPSENIEEGFEIEDDIEP